MPAGGAGGDGDARVCAGYVFPSKIMRMASGLIFQVFLSGRQKSVSDAEDAAEDDDTKCDACGIFQVRYGAWEQACGDGTDAEEEEQERDDGAA